MILKGITKSYGDKQVLKSIDLEVKNDYITWLFGSMGSGKSTVVRILNNQEQADNGIIIDKIPNKNISFLDGQERIFKKLKVIDNLKFYNNIYCSSPEHLTETIKTLQIENLQNEVYEHLSSGNKQLVKIATALLNEHAKLITLDEPFVNLDDEAIILIEQVIEKLQQRKITIVIISHIIPKYKKPQYRYYKVAQGGVYES